MTDFVISWYQLGTNLVPSWYQFGTKLVSTCYQLGTYLVLTWYDYYELNHKAPQNLKRLRRTEKD